VNHPHLFEVSTWPWLERLSVRENRFVTLDTVPAREWDGFAARGFTQVFLMGVWSRSPLGRELALADDRLRAEYDRVLPGWDAADVAGSPYCIDAYAPDRRMGGWAALDVARRADPEDVVVVLLPDGGRGYLSKIFNDDWMARYGFLRSGGHAQSTVADVLAGKGARMPEMVHVHPTETVRDAIDLMREYGVSQLPVLKAEPPVVTGEIAGSLAERDLLDALFTGTAHLHDMVERHMGPPLPMVGGGQPVSEAVALLEKSDAAIVLVDGKPAGVLTRQDLLAHLAPR